jgi:putative membrane protein
MASAAAPGLWDWSLEAPAYLLAAVAVAYRVGSRRTFTPPSRHRAQLVRDGCFYAALAVLAIALCSPLDRLSEQLFWAHMTQHVLLLVLAPPLLVVSAPWIRLWRFLGLDSRRWLGWGLGRSRRAAPLRALARTLGGPTASFVLFAGVLVAWHVPALFDATLSSGALHVLEHSLFLLTAVMFFKQVIPSAPLRIRLGAPQRVLYVVGAMVVTWVLAIVLAVAPHPLYDAYANLAGRPGGISALADQQLAAGIMWVPGSITFVIVIFVYVHRWLTPSEPPSRVASSRLAGEH